MNVPIIYGITIRQPDFRYELELIEISRVDLPENYDDKVKVLSERMLKYLEDVIRKYPDQWFWMHKRWKH
jgi:KDO2-lipid IV(A) lauroyltransferase